MLKGLIRCAFRAAGFELYRCPPTNYKDNPYQTNVPAATYAPWLADSDFLRCYNIIKTYTLVDIYRCYELWQLTQESAKLSGCLLEIGAWKGGSGAIISQSAKIAGISDSVYLCDTFTGVVKAGAFDNQYRGGEHADTSEQIVRDLMKSLNLSPQILRGIFPEETGQYIKELLRFVHIDVDVYQSAKDILEWIWPRLVFGGIVVFDDYGFFSCKGVTMLVNELRARKDCLVVHNLNGHGIIFKIPQSTAPESNPSSANRRFLV
jgi:O-methyltransferase